MSGLISMYWDLFTFAVPICGMRIGLSASQIGMIRVFGVAIVIVRLIISLSAYRVHESDTLIAAITVTGVSLAVLPLVTSAELLMGLAVSQRLRPGRRAAHGSTKSRPRSAAHRRIGKAAKLAECGWDR